MLSEINNIMKSSPKFSGVIYNYVYYIRRGTASEHIETYLNKFGDFVEKEFSIKNIKHSSNIKEKTQAYWDSLDDLSEIMKNKNEKTIIIIDGLDEASKDLFQLVPKSNYSPMT